MQIREQEEIYKAHRHMIYMKIYKGIQRQAVCVSA